MKVKYSICNFPIVKPSNEINFLGTEWMFLKLYIFCLFNQSVWNDFYYLLVSLFIIISFLGFSFILFMYTP